MAQRKNKGGRPRAVTGFRAWAREVVLRPEVQQLILEKAQADADFALKLAEHGFGRPPQALDVQVSGDEDRPLVYKATFADGSPVSTAIAPVSDEADS